MKKIRFLIFSVIPLLGWGYAVIEHFLQQDWLMLAISGIIVPIGVIDGIGMYFGYW